MPADIHENISQGVKSSGRGRDAIKPFNLDKNEELDTSLPDLGVQKALNAASGKMGDALDLLKAGGDGRIQMFSISRLSEQDLNNPFEIRVQVRVDVREIEVEVGGIIEDQGGKRTTALLLVKPPVVVSKAQLKAREDAANKDQSKPQAQTPQNQGRKYLCSEGDKLEGFQVYAIRRDAIILEMMGKYVEVPRGKAVTICVPLSSVN
ncbi:MAG: hypothetical protein LBV12_06815 [Puniceicoccales bacterium]|nr:hypothetical protein [Puniceicoccales bacterium]